MKVFISYQRDDDPNFAGRLRDHFARQFGEKNIYFDVDSIFYGADFVETIRNMITASDCMLVAIGPTWKPERLSREEDYVRMEVLEADRQKKLVIPVLNGDTRMPAADRLPEPLQFLARRNAASIQPGHFDRDVSALIKQIRVQLPKEEPGSELAPPVRESVGDELTRLGVPWTDRSVRTIVGHEGHVLSLSFASSGDVLASGGGDNTARLWDISSGAERLCVSAKGGRVCGVSLTHDGRELLTTSGDLVHVWATGTRSRRAILSGHAGSVWAVALSPDASLVATGSADNTAWLWDTATARRLLTLRGHTGWVTAAAFAPDGGQLATGSTDNVCLLWDPETGHPQRSLCGHSRSLTTVAFSPDGGCLATGSADGTCRVWDAQSGRGICSLEGHRESVTSVAFSRDGRLIVSGGIDGSCRIWSSSTGRQLRAFLGHRDRVHAVAVSPDGTTVASASADATVRLWPLAG